MIALVFKSTPYSGGEIRLVFGESPAPEESQLKAWNGAEWVSGVLKAWNGSVWQSYPLKRWDGAEWV